MNVMKIIVIYFLYAIFRSSFHLFLHFSLHFHQRQPDPEVPEPVPMQVAASKATHVIILHNKLHVFSL